MTSEQQTIKFYESVKLAANDHGFTIETTYKDFQVQKDGKTVARCPTVAALNSWIEAYTFCKNV